MSLGPAAAARGVRTSKLTWTGEALGAVTRMAHGTIALRHCLDSRTLHALSLGRQKM
jgi:hypothetical protein